jgi:hypothetical protein
MICNFSKKLVLFTLLLLLFTLSACFGVKVAGPPAGPPGLPNINFGDVLLPPLPNPVRGQWYPIYNDWLDPTTLTDTTTYQGAKVNPLSLVNVISIVFVHAYTSGDGSQHYIVPPNPQEPEKPSGTLTTPTSPGFGSNNCYLGYENARNGTTSLTAGDYDYNRIVKIATQVKTKNPGAIVLVSLGWSGDWAKIGTDWSTGPENRKFGQSVVDFINVINQNSAPSGAQTKQLIDGFDIDWESVYFSGSPTDMENFLNDLAGRLHGAGLLFSLSPAGFDYAYSSPGGEWRWSSLTNSSLALFDLVNAQTYGGGYSSYIGYPLANLTFGDSLEQGSNVPLTASSYNQYKGKPPGQSAKVVGVFEWNFQDDAHNNFNAANYYFQYVGPYQ